MLTDLTQFAQQATAFSFLLAAQLALVLALRAPVRRWLGASACYRLWLLPLLWLPCYFLGPVLLAVLAKPELAATQSNAPYQLALQQFLEFELLTFDVEPGGSTSLAAGGGLAFSGWAILALVWASGTIALIVWHGRRWLIFSRQVSALGSPLSDAEKALAGTVAHFAPHTPVVRLHGMNSAALFGVFQPALLLPESFCQRYDHNQRHIILAHEAVHLRRGDNRWNLCALLLIALFWTNPLLFFAWRYFRLDQELSCDALALAKCSRDQQKRYARTLLDSLGAVHATQPALSSWDNLRDIKERSLMINKHLSIAARPVATLFSLLALAALGASLTVTFAEFISPAAMAAEPTRPAHVVVQAAGEPAQRERPVERAARQAEVQQRQVETQARQVEQVAQSAEEEARDLEQANREFERSQRQLEQASQQLEQSQQELERANLELERSRQQLEEANRQLERRQQERRQQELEQANRERSDQQRQRDEDAAQRAQAMQAATQQAARDTDRATRTSYRQGRLTRENESGSDAKLIDMQTGRLLTRTVELLNAGQYAEARAELDKVRIDRLSPFEKSRLHQLLFNLEMQAANYPGAREQLQLALDSGGLNPAETSMMRYQMAQLFLQEERYAEAAAALEAWIAAEESPSSAAYYLLATAYFYQNQFARALPNAQQAVDRAGANPQEAWLSLLSATNVELRQYAAAESVMARLVELYPDKTSYRTHLADLRKLNAQ